MVCRNCGANILPGMVECEYCGSRVDAMMNVSESEQHGNSGMVGTFNDVPGNDLESMIDSLSSTSKNVLYFGDYAEGIGKAKAGAQNKYLYKMGYSTDEKILLLYDNAAIKTGESGFTITDKGIYSSGFFLGDKAFYFPLNGIQKIVLENNHLMINEMTIEISLVDHKDRQMLRDIVAKIVFANR